MASRGRPVGSKGTKEKQFSEALRLAINGAEGDQAELRKIAEKLVEKAVAGDMMAIKEVADRLDGKAPQAIVGDADNPLPLITTIQLIAGKNDSRSGC